MQELTTEINEYVAVLWDKTKYIVSKNFYDLWKSPEVPESAILTTSDGASARKSAIAKIDRLKYSYVGRWGKRYSGTYQELYQKVPAIERNALQKQVAKKNEEYFSFS